MADVQAADKALGKLRALLYKSPSLENFDVILAHLRQWPDAGSLQTGIAYAAGHLSSWGCDAFWVDYLHTIRWEEITSMRELHAEYRSLYSEVLFCGFEVPRDIPWHRAGRIAAFHGLRSSLPPKGWMAVKDPAASDFVLESQELSFAQFLGKGYDLTNDVMRIFRYAAHSKSSACSDGLAYALLNPPYSIRLHLQHRLGHPDHEQEERAAMKAFLHKFLREVLAIDNLHDTAHLRFASWSTEWSTFFAAGTEWWGSFCWTVHNLETGRTIALFASATD